MSSQTALTAPGTRLTRFLVWWQAFLAFSGYVTAAGVLAKTLGPDVAAYALVINGGLNLATGVVVAKLLPAAMQQASSGTP